MFPGSSFEIHPYHPRDYASVLRLLRRAARAHVHFDWQLPEECLAGPGVIACLGVEADRFVAVLALSAPDEGASWLRIAAVDHGVSVGPAIRRLWDCAQDRLRAEGGTQVYVVMQDAWLSQALLPLSFVPVDQVVTLRRDGDLPLPALARADVDLTLQPARATDLEAVAALDRAAFEPMWRLSPRELQAAWRQADQFVMAWYGGQQVAGYAIATTHQTGGHLARLATLPALQRHGVGRELLHGVLDQFAQAAVTRVTVNTQGSNLSSQRLYTRFGFVSIGYDLPVLMLAVD